MERIYHFLIPTRPKYIYRTPRPLTLSTRSIIPLSTYFRLCIPVIVMNSNTQHLGVPAIARQNVLQELFHSRWTNDRSKFRASPTDLLMTPCHEKLQAHKQKRCNKYDHVRHFHRFRD